MTHTGPMADEAGDFGQWLVEALPCTQCGGHVQYRLWESKDGAYEGVQFRCVDCHRTWWVDGIDS